MKITVMHPNNEYLVAGDPQTPVSMLRKIFRSADFKTRQRLSENPGTPPAILRKLMSDPHPDVRASIACNPSAPFDVLMSLCLDTDVDVRVALAQEQNLPVRILEILADDSNPYVRDFAETTLERRAFESHLRENGYVHQPGLVARLGELLVEAGYIEEQEILDFIERAQKRKVNLGFILVVENVLPARIIVRALKLQSRVRKGQLSSEAAIEQLRD